MVVRRFRWEVEYWNDGVLEWWNVGGMGYRVLPWRGRPPVPYVKRGSTSACGCWNDGMMGK